MEIEAVHTPGHTTGMTAYTVGKVLTLPDDTVVAPAHFSNVATPNDDGTYTAELGDLVERMDALTTDEESFEFELGPNNCAASGEAMTD